MSEEAVRQTRSQKRALERDVAAPGSPGGELDIKKVKLENNEQLPAADGPIALVAVGGGDVVKMEQAAKEASMSIQKTDEVKATIKVEVQTGDRPVDMSTSKSDLKKERQPLSPNNDVIVLSDNEPSSPVMNGLNHFRKTDTLMKSRPDERECIIKQLMEELRLQEAKLVLLKKLRQSQTQKESTVQKPTSGSVATPPPLVRGSMTSGKGVLQVSSVRSSGTVIPPPLVRGGQHVPSKQNSQTTMPPLVRGAQVTYTLPIAVSPQQIASLRQQQHSGSGPPPLLLAPRASVPNVQVQGQRIIQQGLIRVANVPNTNVLVNIPQGSQKGSSVTSQAGMGSSVSTVQANESPAARQAAAKLALRKQLEKTLLDIPPPKPPAPEFNFLPSAANNEFIYLVGLEEVVQNLLDTLGRGKQQGQSVAPETPVPEEPHTCAQCKTDFTSRWRSEKSGPVLCDHCMSSNLKKALKAEHTNRLKAAFVKALQQEQEIEQRILHQAASPVSKTPSSSSGMKSEHQQHVLVSQQYKQARAQLQQQHRGTPVARHHSSIKQSPGQLSRSVQQAVGSRGVSHSFPTSSQQLQNSVTAAALASRPGKHAMRPAQGTKGSSSNPSAIPNAWRKQTTGNSGVTMAYVNPSLSVNKTTTSANLERQREYLLDMIPSRSISQTANTWK
ncbi:GATA zinc finger domain containing 2Ab isoform X1 [Oncorhynchus mykiss]|uniref:GATA zinc finger domain containing 2Ab isoform X1 n=1 Tax=Oncorhynchus mykiss TaxID=8022 RepID=UPI0018787B02|nr:GATA zinc finger domain containing 2Ab isoform X1 [Oncorhynchus mykiss]